MFNADDLRARLSSSDSDSLESLEILATVDSTSTRLSAAAPPRPGHWKVVIADEQTAGKGRGGNRWQSRPGAGLWMSAAYSFAEVPSEITSLTLRLGVRLAKSLRELCGVQVRLKWPNDLILDDGKVGGILLELTNSGRTVICGIGINTRAPDRAEFLEPAALRPVGLVNKDGNSPGQLELATSVLNTLLDTVPLLPESRDQTWLDDWNGLDWLRDKSCVAIQGDDEIRGVARGIVDNGALLLETTSGVERIVSASIRLEG